MSLPSAPQALPPQDHPWPVLLWSLPPPSSMQPELNGSRQAPLSCKSFHWPVPACLHWVQAASGNDKALLRLIRSKKPRTTNMPHHKSYPSSPEVSLKH